FGARLSTAVGTANNSGGPNSGRKTLIIKYWNSHWQGRPQQGPYRKKKGRLRTNAPRPSRRTSPLETPLQCCDTGTDFLQVQCQPTLHKESEACLMSTNSIKASYCDNS